MTYFRRATGHPAIRSAASFAGATSVVKAIALVKEAVVASVFGVSGAIDAYLMALVIIGYPVQLLANALNPVLVRDYLRVHTDHGDDAADAFLLSSARSFVLILTVVLALWLLLLPQLMEFVGHGLGADQRTTVRYAVYGLTAYYLLTGLNLLGTAALQARKQFLRGGIIPIVTPAVMIVGVLLAGPDLRAMVFALTLGTLLEVLLVFGRFRRWPRSAAGATHPVAQWKRGLATGTAALLPGTALYGLMPMIEQAIASSLGKGAIASLGYASKLPAAISSLLVTAVGITILPYFAEMLARGQVTECRRLYLRYVGLVAVGGAVISGICIIGSNDFVRLAFERGAFSPQDTVAVSVVQQAYLLQLPGALVGMLSVRLIAARGAFLALTTVNVAIVPLVGLMQWWFASTWGVTGVALGTSAGATMSAVLFIALALWLTRGDHR